MSETKKMEKKGHTPRNKQLPSGVYKYSRSKMYSRRALYKINKSTKTEAKKAEPKKRFVVKPIKGEKNGETRLVKLTKEKRYYPTEDRPKRKTSRKTKFFSQHKRFLRKSITPGTVLIIVAGPHKGKRVVFLKQLATGLLLVTGPYKLNHCPLRRINQIYTIATKTKIDIAEFKLPENLTDKYFRREKATKKGKKDDGEIFEKKAEEYTPSQQRKDDQVAVDKQLLQIIKKRDDKATLIHYLKARFSLRNGMYPHKMIF